VTAEADTVSRRAVRIAAGGTTLDADLALPPDARGIVLFAHGSGSSRFSARNRHVAGVLESAGLATLMLDLLTVDEEAFDRSTAALRFDIALLADRVAMTIDWLGANRDTQGLGTGLFGASTGAAAALVAAARKPHAVRAVVSRGGRPDLARGHLAQVRAPTLLIVGRLDVPVIALNETALAQLRCEREIAIVPGASHLFEEPGTLDAVASLARGWFERHLDPFRRTSAR
jgi:putative phosphoribosyl transferase